MTSKKDDNKTVDVTQNYTLDEPYGNTIIDLVVKAIAKRPNYRRMLTEATSVKLVEEYDANGNIIRNESGHILYKEEPKYSDSLKTVTFSNLIVKGMVAAMNDKDANSIIVPSLNGKAVVCKNPLQSGVIYENTYAVHEEYGFSYAVIDFSLEKGRITKESLIGFDGYKFADMVLSVIGMNQLKQLVLNEATSVVEMSEELANYIDAYNPSKIEGLLMKNALASKLLKGREYEEAISQYGRMIKSDARKDNIISMSEHKSRTLSLLVESKLKALYPKVE